MTPKQDGGYSALWHHWGPCGDQNVHIHPHATDNERALVGPGRDCTAAREASADALVAAFL